jgi:hypothetical protein
MSTAPQAALTAGQAEICPAIPVRNLDVIDYLSHKCKWCGAEILDSATKRRKFCNNDNVCCNAYSRDKKRREKVFKHSQFWGPWVYKRETIVLGQGDLFATSEVIFKSTPKRVPCERPKYFGGNGVCPPEGSLATTAGKKVTHEVDVNDRPIVQEPTPIGGLFERNAVHGRHRVSWARGNPKATKQRVHNKQQK